MSANELVTAVDGIIFDACMKSTLDGTPAESATNALTAIGGLLCQPEYAGITLAQLGDQLERRTIRQLGGSR